MNKRYGTLLAVAWMALGLLLPNLARGEYGSYGAYSSGFNANIGKAESTLGSAGSALGSAAKKTGDPTLDLQNELAARVKQAQKDIERSREETQKRERNTKGRDQIDQLKATRALPDILTSNILKRKEQENSEAERLFSALSNSNPGVSSADIQTNNLEPSCRSGVDFSGFKQLADQLGTEPFRYLRENGQQIIAEKNKEAKEAKIKNLQKLAAHFDQVASNNKDDFQQDVAKLDIFKNNNSVEASIARLDQTWDRQKKEIGDLRKDLVKSIFGEFIPRLSEIQANDNRIGQLAAFFADNVESYRRAALDQAVVGAQQLKQNCEDNADFLGRDNPLASRSMVNSAYQWAAAMNPTFANQTLLPMLQQISQNANQGCKDATAKLEELFGSNLQNSIAALRSTKDPRTLLQGAMAVMQQVGSAQAQVGSALQPLMSDCQFMAKQIKKMKDYVGQVGQQLNQQNGGDQQQVASNGQRRTNGGTNNSSRSNGRSNGRGQTANRGTHNGSQPRL